MKNPYDIIKYDEERKKFINSDIGKEVNNYFDKQEEKVYIDRVTPYYGVETFQEYWNHGYRDVCYYISEWAIFGLDFDSKLLRGRINIGDNNDFWYDFIKKTNIKKRYSTYYHGFVQFKYKNKEYIFDNLLGMIIPKKIYYKYQDPFIEYEITLKELIEKYTSEEFANKIDKNTYKIKSKDIGRDTTVTFYPLCNSILELNEDKDKVLKFTAYSPPIG